MKWARGIVRYTEIREDAIFFTYFTYVASHDRIWTEAFLDRTFLFQLVAIALNFGVLVSAVYEGIYARRGGDPTKIRIVTDPRGATINNPGYREYHQPTNGKLGQ